MVTWTELLAFVLVLFAAIKLGKSLRKELGRWKEKGRPLALRERLFNHITRAYVKQPPVAAGDRTA